MKIVLALAIALAASGALASGPLAARHFHVGRLSRAVRDGSRPVSDGSGEPSHGEPAGPAADREAESLRVRTAVEEVLARPEFADLRADPNAFWRWIVERILGLLKSMQSALDHLPHWAAWLIVGWMVLTLLAILAHLVYTLWTILGGSRRLSHRGSAARRHPGELLGIRDLEFEPVYAEACRLLSAGEWLAATKHLYVAAILWLDLQGWIAFRPAKTNCDYLRELQARSQAQDPFRRLTESFEPIVYGGQSATMSTARQMAGIVEGLLHEPA